jgi:uncharacterized membrane protein
LDKKSYLINLENELNFLPLSEKQEVLEDYEEYFVMAHENGRSDEDIIKGLGSPRKIAKEFLAQSEITKASDNPSLNSVSRAVFATVGLGLFNLVFVLAPFIVMILIPFSLFVISAVFLTSPIILLFQEGLTVSFFTSIFLMIGLVGLGLLLIVASIKLFKYFYQVTLSYLHFNLNIVRRKHI